MNDNHGLDYAMASSHDLAGVALEDQGSCRHPESFRTKADDYHWRYEPKLPLELVRSLPERPGPDSPEQCAAWLIGEESASVAEGRQEPGYYADLAKWWLAEPTKAPIVVSLHQGAYHIWGGWHRHAIAVAHGLTTIPAIVGELRKTVQIERAAEGPSASASRGR